ncbi:unnamed protein product [Diatraea saccharalis]|uniref:Fibrinogen C-terminal domain-containing protein n=1 Tax=Diatraea saccharalis TaxID=40085 RepID=A0A9N9N0W9_9NEOP|nr:unnamed protein product [Diatraea saccharalis]
MNTPHLVVLSFLFLSLGSGEVQKQKRGRKVNDYADKSLWKKEYEEELTDAIMSSRKKDNITRIVQSASISDNEVVIDKLMETISSSEKYLKKVDSIDFRLNRLDIEVHEKTNNILKQIGEIMKVIRTEYPDKFEASLDALKSQLNQIKTEGSPSAAADALGLINEFRRTLHEQKSKKCDCKTGRYERSERYPTDCQEIQMQGFNASGIYKIKPEDLDPFYALCDLTTAGGGWTVIQNRFDGSQDFYKSWSDYKHGFGNLAGEFWLGLEKLNYLTNQKLYELRIEMETQHGQEAYAAYSVFTVGPEHEGYRISTLGTFYGTAGDSLAYHAGQKFSTFDIDNDEWKDGACATEHGGAWWYKQCDKSNLNGKYLTSAEDHRSQSIYWISFKGPNSPLSKTRMMIRPLPASKPKNVESNKLRGHHHSSANTRSRDMKPAYEPSRSPYRYEEPTHADAFFPNYA